MTEYKKFNECKVGDTLYCIDYTNYQIVPLTIKDISSNGEITIKEKVPNTTEEEGQYIIDNYYRGDKCTSYNYGICTTYEECKKETIKKVSNEIECVSKNIADLNNYLFKLKNTLKSYES